MADTDEAEILRPEDLLKEQMDVAYAQIDEIKLMLEVTRFRRGIILIAVGVLFALFTVSVALFVLPYAAAQYRELAPAILVLCVIGLYAALTTYLQQETRRRQLRSLLQRLTAALDYAKYTGFRSTGSTDSKSYA